MSAVHAAAHYFPSCASPSSPTSTATSRPSMPSWRTSATSSPTRSGAWATSSATAPTRTPACELAREQADLCLVGNHDLAVTRRPAADRVLARRRAGGGVDPEAHRAGATSPTWASSSPPMSIRPSASTTPARATRCGSTCSRSPLADLCLDAQRHRVCMIGHSHVALAFGRDEGDRDHGRDPRRGGSELDIVERRVAAEPGLGGPAPRRRPPRGLAAARHRRVGGPLAAGPVRHRRGRGGDPRGRSARVAGRALAIRAVSPSAF